MSGLNGQPLKMDRISIYLTYNDSVMTIRQPQKKESRKRRRIGTFSKKR
jgi:hypothetical protein